MASEKQKSGDAGFEPFPGGSAAPKAGELRIAVEKKPYAEIIGHAVLEPEVEVCGVLVGKIKRDQHGDYLHVTHVIKGEAAKKQGAQVTFTHDTWNHIHEQMDKLHADKQIVGWYHTHGGFGIFLSDMDSFIHRNFFTDPNHVAYVFDPLAGSEGFFVLRDGELKPLGRYWLAGRERAVLTRAEPAAPGGEGGSSDLAAAVTALQRTVSSFQGAILARENEGPSLWVLLAGIAVVALLGLTLFTRGPLLEVAGNGARDPGPLLILERDPHGRAVGLELIAVEQEDGPVFRDRTGRLFVGVELRGADGKPTSVESLLGRSTAPASALAPEKPATTPPEKDQPPKKSGAGSSRTRWLGAAAIGGLAVAGLLAGIWLRRRKGTGSVT
jgi:proteasome lid subunit RPN8/RPN11